MNLHLPTDLLRNFITIANYGSMVRAAPVAGLTQSALSLQMKKLAALVETPLFTRHRGGLMLTPAGEALLVYARGIVDLNDRAFAALVNDVPAVPIRVGVVQDFAALLVSGALSRFRQLYPDANLRIKAGTTLELHTSFDAGLLDMMIGFGAPEDPHVVGDMQMRWLGAPGLGLTGEVPVAVMDAPCPFRDAMVEALTAAGRPYRIVLETPGVAVLGAAINAGLALTCRTSSLPFVDDREPRDIGVPLGRIAIVVRYNEYASTSILKLHSLVREALSIFMTREWRS